MKWRVAFPAILFLAIIFLAILFLVNRGNDRRLGIDRSSRPFPLEKLHALTPFSGSWDQDGAYLLLIYMPEVSCSSCTDRDLSAIAERYQKPGYPWLMVTGPGKLHYLKRLKRVLGLDFPVVLEEPAGHLGLHPEFRLFFLDLHQGRALVTYTPNPDPNTSTGLELFIDIFEAESKN
jgi:hypothetical protein